LERNGRVFYSKNGKVSPLLKPGRRIHLLIKTEFFPEKSPVFEFWVERK